MNDITKALYQIRDNLNDATRRFSNAMKGQEGRAANRALSKLRTEPGPSIKPTRWKSDKQRRAFFASNGFGAGIPYRRSGRASRGWQATFDNTPTGGTLTIEHEWPQIVFVQGDYQQPFHQDTGWVRLDDVVDDFEREAIDVGVEVWIASADPFEGI